MKSESIATSWRTAWKSPAFRVRALTTVPVLAATLALLAKFLSAVEIRPGAVLADPVLIWFEPVNLNWLTFTLIYGALFAAIGSLLHHPHRLLFAFQAYVLMVVFRVIAMWLTPLDPPYDVSPLMDPFVEYVGTGTPLTKDLFFSGHASTLFLLFLVTPRGVLKWLFLACTVLVACAVLVQHVHYTIDVFAAPFFAYAAFAIVQRLNRTTSASADRADTGGGCAIHGLSRGLSDHHTRS